MAVNGSAPEVPESARGFEHRHLGEGIQRKSLRGRWEQKKHSRGVKFGERRGNKSTRGPKPAVRPVGPEATQLTPVKPKRFPVPRGTVVLDDVNVPDGRAGVDYVAVGPGGVTVIKATNLSGRVRVHDDRLWINRKDRTELIDDLCHDLAKVRAILLAKGLGNTDVRAVISTTIVDGLPRLRRLKLEGVVIDGPRRIASIASREPHGDEPVDVKAVARIIRERIPRANASVPVVSNGNGHHPVANL